MTGSFDHRIQEKNTLETMLMFLWTMPECQDLLILNIHGVSHHILEQF